MEVGGVTRDQRPPIGGDTSSNRLLLPRGPRTPVSGHASKAPGCLGTLPNKYTRTSSLSGKQAPSSPAHHHQPRQLCSVGTLHDPGIRTPGAKSHTCAKGLGEPLPMGVLLLHPYIGAMATTAYLEDQMGGTGLPCGGMRSLS